MSQASSYPGAIVAAFQADLDFSFQSCMVALVAYEYILTVNQEVAMIWRRRWTLVTWLFIANRYIMIAVIIWDVSPSTAQYAYITSVVNFTVDPVFGTVCSTIPNVSVRTTFQCKCSGIINLVSHTKMFEVSLGTHLALIAADVLVLALTWNRTFTHRMAAIRVGVQTPLSAMLLRDGTVYFVVLLAINLTDVIGNTVPSLQATSAVTSNLIGTLTPILISRFLLNLRQLGEPENETQSRFNSRFSVPGFRVPTLESIVGNMGADLYHGPAEEVDGEVKEADMDGGDAEVSMLDVIAQDCSGGLSMENVYERQEVPSQVP
ncbi:hypothetical protein EW026_g6701 [Hermanssonia centrifuga]|uniref:DUF6533 domain-containing protein n=1 Tax=Hermanssonia centrifuga TaxID=98765 RepID=A0A4S4KEJ0_9APHY|nr:hypothetical protein EW026_g6701 [Hermanssonia centrifuga]